MPAKLSICAEHVSGATRGEWGIGHYSLPLVLLCFTSASAHQDAFNEGYGTDALEACRFEITLHITDRMAQPGAVDNSLGQAPETGVGRCVPLPVESLADKVELPSGR